MRSWNWPFSRNSSALWCAWKKSRLVVSSALSPVIVSPSISKHALLCSRSFENASCTSMWPCCLASTAMAVSPMPLCRAADASLLMPQARSRKPSWSSWWPWCNSCGWISARALPGAGDDVVHVPAPRQSASFHHGTGSQRLGVRRRHVSITSWMSVRLCPGFWCCGRCASGQLHQHARAFLQLHQHLEAMQAGACAAAPSSGNFHQRSQSSFTACFQHCSASATRPLLSAA